MKPHAKDINRLIESLREEMTQYGELLALMQEQQALILSQQSRELLANSNEVNGQMVNIKTARQAREKARVALATHLGAPQETTIRQITGYLPEEYRPLLAALVDEINALPQNVHVWLRQNDLMMKRSLN